jgi:membrane-associated phospholipid phosphatase
MPPSSPTTWTANIAVRMRRHFLLKLVGTTVWTWIFFIAYFHLLRHPSQPALVMPLTAIDHFVPFQPAALYAYLTLWFYVGIAPGLQRNFKELVVYGLWAGALCMAGLTCFYLWPTSVPALAFDVSGFPGFAMLQGVDAAGNACPSMHVAIALFSAIWLDHILRETGSPWYLRALNGAWFAAIAWSTLATKQHVAIDVIAGAVLGLAFALASLRWRPGRTGRTANANGADIIDHQRSKAAPAAVMSTDIAP